MTIKANQTVPIFVKGKIKLEVDGYFLEYRERNISLFGVTGLSWAPLVAAKHFGQAVMLVLHIPAKEPVIFRTRAYITSESTRYSSHMGLKFELGPAQTLKLRKTIEEFGFSPTDHNRRYPRIPAYEWIGDFPVRATVKLSMTKTSRRPFQAVFDVSDLSPTGCLLETENPAASILMPGQRIQVTLEPRGKASVGVTLPALICRTVDALNQKNGNVQRQLGLSFVGLGKTTQTVYLSWLRDILTDLKHGRPRFR